MRDGSDAIADWPILNALLNVAAGATWVSVHHGGGVGIGNSIHAGMVVVADGSGETAERLERVLTTDPGTGVLRHADAGYDEAIEAAEQHGLELPIAAHGRRVSDPEPAAVSRLLVRDLAQLATSGRASMRRCGARRWASVDVVEDAFVLCEDGRIAATGRMRDLAAARRRRRGARRLGSLRRPGARRLPHARLLRRRPGRGVRPPRAAARATRSCTPPAAGSSRPSGRRGPPARRGCEPPCGRHRGVDAPRRDDDVRGEVRLRARPRDRARVASGDRGRGRDPDLARRARGAAGVRRRRRVPRLRSWRRCCRRRRELAEAADVFVEEGAFDVEQARRYLEALPRGRPRAPAARRPVHRARRRPARGRARRALGRPPRGDRRRRASARWRRARSWRSCCPRARSSSTGRCRRRARSSTPAPPSRSRPTSTRAAPSARACRSSARSPARSSTSRRRRRSPRARSTPRTSSAGRSHRPCRPGVRGGSRAARRARLALPRLPPRRRRGRDGDPTRRGRLHGLRPRYACAMPTRKQRRRRQKDRRHEYEFVYVDDEGEEVEVDEDEASSPRPEREA